MGKGTGGGGAKSGGGVGGRSAGSPKGMSLAAAAKTFGTFFGAGLILQYAGDPMFQRVVDTAAKAAGQALLNKVVPVTAKMRDNVRTWAADRASRARGEVQTEGVAMAAAKAALTGKSQMGPVPKSVPDWRSIPDNSIFGNKSRSYTGKDIKSLVRDAVKAQKNHIANAPKLEASTAPRNAAKASGLAASVRGSTKSKRQKRNLERAKKAMKKK